MHYEIVELCPMWSLLMEGHWWKVIGGKLKCRHSPDTAFMGCYKITYCILAWHNYWHLCSLIRSSIQNLNIKSIFAYFIIHSENQRCSLNVINDQEDWISFISLSLTIEITFFLLSNSILILLYIILCWNKNYLYSWKKLSLFLA